MTQEQKNWYDFGYEQQCSRCPLLDHVWGGPEYPIELQKYYRQGQVQAFLDEKAERPGFLFGNIKTYSYLCKKIK